MEPFFVLSLHLSSSNYHCNCKFVCPRGNLAVVGCGRRATAKLSPCFSFVWIRLIRCSSPETKLPSAPHCDSRRPLTFLLPGWFCLAIAREKEKNLYKQYVDTCTSQRWWKKKQNKKPRNKKLPPHNKHVTVGNFCCFSLFTVSATPQPRNVSTFISRFDGT